MTCPHTETTTIAWIYGEGPEDHEMHVAQCMPCQEALAIHEEVQFTLSGLRTDVAGTVSSVVEEPAPVVAANRPIGVRMFGVIGLGLAAAAVFMMWMGSPTQINPGPVDVPEHSQQAVSSDPVQSTESPDDTHSVDAPNPSSQSVAMTEQPAKTHWDFDGFDDGFEDTLYDLDADIGDLEDELSTL
jgi:hypothetical protein